MFFSNLKYRNKENTNWLIVEETMESGTQIKLLAFGL